MARVRIRVPVYRVSTTGRVVRKGTKTTHVRVKTK